MAKISKGQVGLSDNRIPVIHVNEERGTLIQNCGYTENGKHILTLQEGLFLHGSGLLTLEPKCFLEKKCCKTHGVHATSQSINLFELGVKNMLDVSDNEVFLFKDGNHSGRLFKANDTSKIYPALPDEDIFYWLSKQSSQSEEKVFAYMQLAQSYAYFQIQPFEPACLKR